MVSFIAGASLLRHDEDPVVAMEFGFNRYGSGSIAIGMGMMSGAVSEEETENSEETLCW